jgi:ketopantoate hydroxymethyltransferase
MRAMTYTVKAQWMEQYESEHESLDDAVAKARAIMRDNEAGNVCVEGEGALVSFFSTEPATTTTT